MPTKLWMVRAGKNARYVDDFLDEGVVGLGGTGIGDADCVMPEVSVPKEEILRRLQEANPHEGEGTLASWASQIRRYTTELQSGDQVTTYDPGQRVYFLGTLQGDMLRKPDHELDLQHRVEWTSKVSRDGLSVSTRNSLGAILSLFLVPKSAAAEMRSKAVGLREDVASTPSIGQRADGRESEKELLDEQVSKAAEFIEDRIARLGWRQMQDLVAGLLEAMGYRARVSPEGADRGVDIFASPDGLGLEEPRIFVEVKHRPGTSIGSQDVRAFLGGRKEGDRCLYVSTGGFTKDARYEADRARVPLRLLTLPDLRELLTEHYESLDASVAAQVPLEKIYWPTA